MDAAGVQDHHDVGIGFRRGGIDGAGAQSATFSKEDSYKYSWSPAKDYVPGKVYKIENKPFVTTTAAQAMPR